MKRVVLVFLALSILLVGVSFADVDPAETLILNADFFDIFSSNQDALKTKERTLLTAAMICSYAAINRDDEICGNFVSSFRDYWSDMEVAIGNFKLGFTELTMAFRNGEFYNFEVVYLPMRSVDGVWLDKPYIEVTQIKDQAFYDNFDAILLQMEGQKVFSSDKSMSLKYTHLSADDLYGKLIDLLGDNYSFD